MAIDDLRGCVGTIICNMISSARLLVAWVCVMSHVTTAHVRPVKSNPSLGFIDSFIPSQKWGVSDRMITNNIHRVKQIGVT